MRCLPHLGVILRSCFGKGTSSSDPRSTATADTHKHCAAARPDKTLVLPTASSLDRALRRVLPPGTTLQVGPERTTAGTSRYSSFREHAAKTGKWRCLPAGSEHVHCTLLLDHPRPASTPHGLQTSTRCTGNKCALRRCAFRATSCKHWPSITTHPCHQRVPCRVGAATLRRHTYLRQLHEANSGTWAQQLKPTMWGIGCRKSQFPDS